MGTAPGIDFAAGRLSRKCCLISLKEVWRAPRSSELGPQLEYIIELLQDVSAPAVVLIQQTAGLLTRQVGPFEQDL